jgi:hypothetical protein
MLRHLLMCCAIDRRSVRPRSSSRRSSCFECLEGRTLLAATPYMVTNTSNSADISGSLPWAVSQADANTNPDGSVIQFSQAVFSKPQTITLKSTLTLSEPYGPIVINGPGANLVTVSGNNAVGVFDIQSSVTATLSGLTISGGQTSVPGGGAGGITNGGTLAITACNITNNSGFDGGGINNSNVLTLKGSSIANNSGSSGGGIFNSDVAIVSDCAIASNSAPFGGGGVDNDKNGSLILIDCTIADNSGNPGGGIANSGTVGLVNSTVAFNTVGFLTGAGIGGGGGALGLGGGLFAYATSPGTGGVVLENTIVALNTDDIGPHSQPADDIAGLAPASGGNNLIGTGGSLGLVNGKNGNQVGVANPGIAPLGNYGGLDQTCAEYLGSPAEGAGSVASDGGQSTDGRGPGFPRLNNGAIDIGAYEIQPVTYTKVVKSTAAGWGTDGDASLQTDADGVTLVPVGRKHDLPWYGIDSLQVTFDQPVVLSAADVTLSSAIGVDYGPVTVTGMGTSYTVMFGKPIDKADRVMVSISIPETDTFMGRLNVLPGDFYDTGVVTSKDLTAIKNESTGKHGAEPTIFGDVLGNGTVNSSDYRTAKHFLGTRLPKLSRLAKAGGYASSLASERHAKALRQAARPSLAERKHARSESLRSTREIGTPPCGRKAPAVSFHQ